MLLMLLAAGCCTIASCGSDDDGDLSSSSTSSTTDGSTTGGGEAGGGSEGGSSTPTITLNTGKATFITDCTATLEGSITSSVEPVAGTEIGIVYSSSESTPTLDNADKAAYTGNIDAISVDVDYLTSNTKYYYRTYAGYGGQYQYGEVKTFTTKRMTSEEVDMGLSVYWASHNVGGYNPEDYGGYYAWSETKEKSTYSNYTAIYFDGFYNDTKHPLWKKYAIDPLGNTIDNKTILDTSDDAARQNMYSTWRMPTKAECEKLIDDKNTDKKFITRHGVKGTLLVSKLNGNYIFLPHAGEIFGDKFILDGDETCFYLSSELYIENQIMWGSCYAYGIVLNAPTKNQEGYTASIEGLSRTTGFPVRAVKNK